MASGILVSQTGRYRVLIVASVIVTLAGLGLMTRLQAATELPILWAWMFVTGVGLGPTLAVFMLAVQNAVAEADMGVATSSQTFFRQVGGSVALAVAGTIFSSSLRADIPAQMAAAGVPQQIVSGFTSAGFDLNQLRGAGVDLGAQILSAVPASARAIVEPVVPNMVAGIHQAISLSIADTFAFAAIVTVVGLAVVALLPESRTVRAMNAASRAEESVPAGSALLPDPAA